MNDRGTPPWLAAFGVAACVVFGLYVLILGGGTAVGLARSIPARGLADAFGPHSWSYAVCTWAIALFTLALTVAAWALGAAGALYVLVASGQKGVAAVAQGATAHPVATVSAALGLVIAGLADGFALTSELIKGLYKEYAAGSSPLSKELTSFAIGVLFLTSGCLFASSQRAHKVAGAVLYSVVPCLLLMWLFVTHQTEAKPPAEGAPAASGTSPSVWMFLATWLLFTTAVALVAFRRPGQRGEF